MIKGVVKEKRDNFRFFVLKVEIINEEDKTKVISGKMRIGVIDEATEAYDG